MDTREPPINSGGGTGDTSTLTGGQLPETPQAQTDLTVRQMFEAMTRMMDQQARNLGGQSEQVARPDSHDSIYVRFKKLDPPTFSGTTGEVEAENWLKRIEQLFRLMTVTDEQQILLATFMLTEEAHQWWEATSRLLTTPVVGGEAPQVPMVVTWKKFKEEFDGKYLPESYRNEKEQEFTMLKQHGMTVSQYEARFTALSRFAPTMVATEAEKCRRFRNGLDYEIRSQFSTQTFSVYSDLVEAARKAEKDVNEGNQRREQFKKARQDTKQHSKFPSKAQSWSGQSFHPARGSGGNFQPRPPVNKAQNWSSNLQSNSSPRQGGQGKGVFDNRSGSTQCWNCGKTGHVARNCTTTFVNPSIVCHSCGQPGHYRRNCPGGGSLASSVGSKGSMVDNTRGKCKVAAGNTQGRGGSMVGGQTSGRVYAMNRQDALATPDVVTGVNEAGDSSSVLKR